MHAAVSSRTTCSAYAASFNRVGQLVASILDPAAHEGERHPRGRDSKDVFMNPAAIQMSCAKHLEHEFELSHAFRSVHALPCCTAAMCVWLASMCCSLAASYPAAKAAMESRMGE